MNDPTDIQSVTDLGAVLRVATTDGTVHFVPDSEANRERQILQRWIEAGGQIQSPPSKPRRQQLEEAVAAIDAKAVPLLFALVRALVQKGTLAVADLPPALRSAYQDRKAATDELEAMG